MSEFHDRLREERKRLGLNQTQFAALAGVTLDSQSNYERGLRKPDSAYLAAAAVQGMDVLYVLTGTRSVAEPGLTFAESRAAYAVTREEQALLDNFRHASPEGQAAIKATSDALAKPHGGKRGKAA